MDIIKTILDLINAVLKPQDKILFTKDQLKNIYGISDSKVNEYYDSLNSNMNKYKINNKERVCAFLAQIGHESGRLKYSEEIWGPTAAQKGYEGRKDLGNTQPGDGSKFRGRGLIQITGRDNYKKVSDALGEDFISQPELLSTSQYAVESACWWWANRKRNGKYLNEWADINTDEAFEQITRGINGGINGLKDRISIWNKAKSIL